MNLNAYVYQTSICLYHRLGCIFGGFAAVVFSLQQQQQQQQKYLLTQIIYKAMIHEYTEYKISKIE